MATSADHPVAPSSQIVPGMKVGVPLPQSSGTSLGCLPRHSRQSSGNYPDIVDNDNCFQPVISNSADDLSAIVAASLQSSGDRVVPSTSSGGEFGQLENGTYRQLSDPNTPNQHTSTSSGEDYNGSDNVWLIQEQSSLDVLQRNNSQPPPYRADTRPSIRTHDLNVGVTGSQTGNAIPDILFSHMVPQVPPSRPNQHRHVNRGNANDQGGRRRGDNQGRRHSRNHQRDVRQSPRNRPTRTQVYPQHRETCKEPCLKCLSSVTSFKCVLVLLSLIGVCCVITGIVLGALHAVAGSFLFLAIMFLGLGILLVVVVFVGWRCTPRGHEPCHALFGLGDHRRHRRRHGGRPHRSRDGNWYGGMMYPEFNHRRPPPSYTASMQEYQQQLVMAQQQYMESVNTDNYSLPSSPPPTYRSHVSVRPSIQITFPPNQTGQYPSSRPPTYRSHTSTIGQQAHARPALPFDQNACSGDQVVDNEPHVQIDNEHVSDRSRNVVNSVGHVATSRDGPADTSQHQATGACEASTGTSSSIRTVAANIVVPGVQSIAGSSGTSTGVTGTASSSGSPPANIHSSSSHGAQTAVNRSNNSSSFTSSTVEGAVCHALTNGSPEHMSVNNSVNQSPSSHGGEESVVNLLDTTLRTFEEITSSEAADSISQSSGDIQVTSNTSQVNTDQSHRSTPPDPHTNKVTTQTPL